MSEEQGDTMTEQVIPTDEENDAVVEAAENEATPVIEEVVAEAEVEAPVIEASEPKKEEVPLVRKVAGPPTYVPSESRGRVRRIGNDVRVDQIDYKNISLLSRFLDPRGRIIPRRKTRVSAKVQRRVVKAIKRARHLALLPYTAEHIRITRKHK